MKLFINLVTLSKLEGVRTVLGCALLGYGTYAQAKHLPGAVEALAVGTYLTGIGIRGAIKPIGNSN